MGIIKATVILQEEKHFIRLQKDRDLVDIPISEDRPSEVKNAFNKLILWTRSESFTIEFESLGDDLFNQVAKEYVIQLNLDISQVRMEMEQHGLLSE